MSHGDHVSELPPGFHALATQRQLAGGGVHRRPGHLRHPVPPRGGAHAKRARGPAQLPLRRLPLQRRPGRPDPSSPRPPRASAPRSASGRVICALSGGVDSAVAATLVHRAIGDQLTCVFVNNGLLRKEEPERVLAVMHGNLDMNIRYVDATDRFLRRAARRDRPRAEAADRRPRVHLGLRGRRRRASGHIDFLAQGTLYPDVIESTAPDVASTAVEDQDAPQRRRPPAGPALPAHRAAALPVQGRGARGRRSSWACPRRWSTGSRSPGPGLAIRCLGEVTAGAARDPAQRGLGGGGRDQAQRPVPPGVAVVRGAHAARERRA